MAKKSKETVTTPFGRVPLTKKEKKMLSLYVSHGVKLILYIKQKTSFQF